MRVDLYTRPGVTLTLFSLVCALNCALKPLPTPVNRPPPRTPTHFILSHETPLPMAQLRPAELTRYFPAFKPSPSTNEYSHFVLPFTGGPTEDDKLKAYAFSFLLSNALDWGPGNYCSRHAYFTFKRSGLSIVDAGQTLHPSALKALAKRWSPTHFVGGEIRAGTNGFTGVLKVLDLDGVLLKAVPYDTPRPYFALLGDMSVDALQTLGYRPSPSLVAHLHIPRCKDEALLVELGRAAFADERSDGEFDIYKRILVQEPDFAEVRYWWANQSHWVTGDSEFYRREMVRSMRSYITKTGLEDVELSADDDKDPTFNYDTLIRETERLVGSKVPVSWLVRFRASRDRRQACSINEAKAATDVAAAYPNNFKLLSSLMAADRYGLWRGDFSMIGGISLAKLQSRNLPSSYAVNEAAYKLGLAARELGYDHIAAEMLYPLTMMALSRGETNDVCNYGYRLAQVLQDMGQYEQSFELGVLVVNASDPDSLSFNLLNAVMSGLIAGKTNEVDGLIRKTGSDFPAWPKNTKLLKAYLALAKGDTAPAIALTHEEPATPDDAMVRQGLQRLLLYAQLDLQQGRMELRQTIRAAHCLSPHARPLWILVDAYDRLDPRPEDEGFYEALGWLHNYDPWVKEALAARSRRMPRPRVLDLQKTLASLDAYLVSPWPLYSTTKVGSGPAAPFLQPPRWEYTSAIRKMIEMKEYDRASEFTCQCIGMTVGPYLLDTHFNHLYHMVQAARAADTNAPSRTLPPPPSPFQPAAFSPALQRSLTAW